jgi:hypothetical protein
MRDSVGELTGGFRQSPKTPSGPDLAARLAALSILGSFASAAGESSVSENVLQFTGLFSG